MPPDLALDLDLDLPEDALTEAPAAPGGFATALSTGRGDTRSDSDDISTVRPGLEPFPSAPWSPEEAAPSPTVPAPMADNLDFPRVDELSMAPSGAMPLGADAQDSAPMEFDLGELSLDLNAPSQPMARPGVETAPVDLTAQGMDDDDGSAAAQDDPLATKLALAEEFNAIGDTDGARTLIEEVVAEATGPLKTRAQRMLADLG
jgi:pilus assembly protein FimV